MPHVPKDATSVNLLTQPSVWPVLLEATCTIVGVPSVGLGVVLVLDRTNAIPATLVIIKKV